MPEPGVARLLARAMRRAAGSAFIHEAYQRALRRTVEEQSGLGNARGCPRGSASGGTYPREFPADPNRAYVLPERTLTDADGPGRPLLEQSRLPQTSKDDFRGLSADAGKPWEFAAWTPGATPAPP